LKVYCIFNRIYIKKVSLAKFDLKDYLKVEGKKMKINEMNNFERNKTKNQPEQKEEHRKK